MEIVNLDKYNQNFKLYGGASCLKIGLTVDGVDYLVKFPGNLTAKNLKNVALSYSNGSICEFLGSHVFELAGLPVHETKLGFRNGKIVVMCKDFVAGTGKEFYEFAKIKATYEPAFVDRNGNVTDGMGSSLNEALLVLETHPIFGNEHNAAIERFWEVFVLDALIGNPDRNNGNWGILVSGYKVELAPVFDNGNCLNDKWDEDKMLYFMQDEHLFLNEAYKGKVCFFTNNEGKKINPFQLIESCEYWQCTKALRKILATLDIAKVYELVDNVTVLTDVQKSFYKQILRTRYEYLCKLNTKLLKPVNSF